MTDSSAFPGERCELSALIATVSCASSISSTFSNSLQLFALSPLKSDGFGEFASHLCSASGFEVPLWKWRRFQSSNMKPPRYSLSARLNKEKELLFNLKNKSQKVRTGKQRGELKGFLFPPQEDLCGMRKKK